MKDYFSELKMYIIEKDYTMNIKREEYGEIKLNNVLLNNVLDKYTKHIYEKYKKFEIVWYGAMCNYIGSIIFVSSDSLDKEHEELIKTMEACYDTELDELDIVDDIYHWYPLFYFPNGDAFCLDVRTGEVVFFEHEVFEGSKDLYGLLIAKSINELYRKWNQIHFRDVYNWDEVVNNNGLDLSCELMRRYVAS